MLEICELACKIYDELPFQWCIIVYGSTFERNRKRYAQSANLADFAGHGACVDLGVTGTRRNAHVNCSVHEWTRQAEFKIGRRPLGDNNCEAFTKVHIMYVVLRG